MGYSLHITRAEEWFESEHAPITLDEWLDCVRDDRELRLEQTARTALSGGEVLEMDLPGLAVWTAWSRHDESNAMVYFWHSEGCVDSRGVDDEVVGKLYQIAQRLGARVFGDDGEEYGADGVPAADDASTPPPRQSWWRWLFGGER